jgi:alpha-galactosidase
MASGCLTNAALNVDRNFYHCNIDERAIKQIALTLKSSGLAAKGYRYVNIDDCWQVAREPVTGVIVPDPARFPSGLKAIADWLHNEDMMFGIYTAAHGTTCQSRPGSYLYEQIDSRSYCGFGIDYLKIDQCGGDSYERHHEAKNMSWLAFQRGFKECLQSTGRAIVQSVESCGTVSGCGQWIANCANLWRTGSDLEATWGSVMKNLDQTAPLFSLAGISDTGMGVAGHWNDPDMRELPG